MSLSPPLLTHDPAERQPPLRRHPPLQRVDVNGGLVHLVGVGGGHLVEGGGDEREQGFLHHAQEVVPMGEVFRLRKMFWIETVHTIFSL